MSVPHEEQPTVEVWWLMPPTAPDYTVRYERVELPLGVALSATSRPACLHAGGVIPAPQAYRVGERGPELFAPR